MFYILPVTLTFDLVIAKTIGICCFLYNPNMQRMKALRYKTVSVIQAQRKLDVRQTNRGDVIKVDHRHSFAGP